MSGGRDHKVPAVGTDIHRERPADPDLAGRAPLIGSAAVFSSTLTLESSPGPFMKGTTLKRATLVVALALLAAACGDGGTATTTAAPATAAPTTAAPTTTTAAPTTTEATTTTTTAAPTTTEATTTTTAAPIVPGEDPDVDAIVLAYTTALDSLLEFEDKAPFIEDSADLEDTVAQYNATGQMMSGIGAMPLEVTIDGDTAVVTYQILFGGSPSYSPQTGAAIKVDDTWKVTREAFCALMTLARGGCP